MPFESLINPHDVAYGSTTVLGVTHISYAPVSLPPQAVIADDNSVAIHPRSAHDAYNGTITLNDPTEARSLAAQVGPATFSFNVEASDGGADKSYSFAGAEFSAQDESVGTGRPAGCTLSWSGKALTVT